jgi:transcriptional regulator with XRE-family HTH domain
MDVSTLIKARLDKLGFEQKALAAAAEVTESYVSQLLNRKKLPPAPDRTDIYEKMGSFLRLPKGELPKLAGAQRMEKLRRGFEEAPTPLLKDVRELILSKCVPNRQQEIRAIFERQPFGELERFVTRKLLDVISKIAREELDNRQWLQEVARLSNKSYAQMRVIMLEFLDTDIFNISNENCVSFLSPLIAYWDIDLSTFDMEIALNDRLVPGRSRKLVFVEKEPDDPLDVEPGFTEFLQDDTLSVNVTREELEFLKSLRFRGKRPNALYYYRELQSLRDPLHFRDVES